MSRTGGITLPPFAGQRRQPPLAWRFAVWVLCLVLLAGCGLFERPGNTKTPSLESGVSSPVGTSAGGSATPAGSTAPTGVDVTAAPQTLPTGGLGAVNSILWTPGSGGIAVAAEGGLTLVDAAQAGSLQPQTLTTPSAQQATAAVPSLLSGAENAPVLGWVVDENIVFTLNTSAAGSAPVQQAQSDSPVTGLAVAPAGDRVAFTSFDGKLTVEAVGDQPGAQVVQTFDLPHWLTSLSFSPDGKLVGGTDQANFTVYVLDTATGQVQRRLEWADSPTGSLYFALFSPNWNQVAWVSQASVQIMDASDGSTGQLLSHEEAVSAAAWSPDGGRLATAAAATVEGALVPAVLVWDTQSGDVLATWAQTAPVKSLAFSPDGRQVAVLDTNGNLRVWNLEQ